MAQDVEKNTIEVYKAMVAMEGRKSNIYSNLWTILFTSLAAILGFFYSKPETNYMILPVIPVLIAVWAAFICFNHFYLTALRTYIRAIEKSFTISVKVGDDSKLWFKDVFPFSIRERATPFLFIIVGVFACGFIYFVAYNLNVYSVAFSKTVLGLTVWAYWSFIGLIYIIILAGFIIVWLSLYRKVEWLTKISGTAGK